MKGWTELDRFLRTDPRDVGCEHAIEALHTYVELQLSGQVPDDRYAGLVAHLEACGLCAEDFEGLRTAALALARTSEDEGAPGGSP